MKNIAVASIAAIYSVEVFVQAFTSPTVFDHRKSKAWLDRPRHYQLQSATGRENESVLFDDERVLASITPKGYGLSTPASRILKEVTQTKLQQDKDGVGEKKGYYRATANEKVIDVVVQITDGDDGDVALVFSDDSDKEVGKELLGIFTEKDYINFSTQRALETTSEEESAKFLLAPISNFVTPTSSLISISPLTTASKALALMQQYNVRHLVIADKITSDFHLLPSSLVEGVINLQNVMMIIQRDERLSLDNLRAKFPGFSDNPLAQMREEIKSQANALAKDPETVKKDLIKAGTTLFSVAALTSYLYRVPFLSEHTDLAMIGIFVLGYVAIIFENVFEFNKGAVALLMSTGLWVTYADFFGGMGPDSEKLVQLRDQLAEVSDICFFLLAASTIVEVVDAHQGFKVVTNLITTKSKKALFWTIGFLTFFLSAILNNLTVTIVMCSLLRKLVPNDEDRKLFGAMVVVAANAGGVWTPIGDVTTTMLWINHQLSTIPTITELFLPSVICLVASLFFLVSQVNEDNSLKESTLPEPSSLAPRGQLVFWTGIGSLLVVPVFAELTGLPPYLAMLTGLGAIWTLTDILHMGEEEKNELRVPAALAKLDTSGILFFLGVLMSIGVLDKSGLLKELAVFLNENLPSVDIIATVIGLASALIDNVPLVAATMGMYDLTDFSTDDKLWQLIALCAGTGGSILVIGSASGVALMGLEKVDFMWYTKKVSVGATVGYFAGIATYLLQNAILHGTGLFNALLPQATAAVDVVSQTIQASI